MSKFHYCSSQDELSWYIDPGTCLSMSMSAEELSGCQHLIKHWIEDTCVSEVYVWNNVSTPDGLSTGWGQKIAPQGGATIFFTNEKDATLFTLKWKNNPGA